jgi:hypothetical protein
MSSFWISAAALAAFVYGPSLAAGNRDLGAWDNLSRVNSGQRIEVIEMNLKRTRGEFIGSSQQELQIKSPTGLLAIPRGQVMRVSLIENSKRLRNALIGMAVGAAAGLATGAAVDASFSEDGENLAKTIFVPIGIGIGAAVGTAVPGFETIYRAPKRIPPSTVGSPNRQREDSR